VLAMNRHLLLDFFPNQRHKEIMPLGSMFLHIYFSSPPKPAKR